MLLTFLEASVPLTKQYVKNSDGSYTGGAYPGVTNFTSHVEEITSIAQFADQLKTHATAGHCLLTSGLERPIKNESRAKLGLNEPRSWILLDIDGLNGVASVEDFITKVLPQQFHGASYVVQYSPSQGIKPGVRAHLFFMLGQPIDAQGVESWIVDLNLSHQVLSSDISLSSSGTALSYPLDRVASRNSRIVYIAPPECVGFDDPVTERIQAVEKEYERVHLHYPEKTPAQIAHLVRDKVNELRAAANLPVSRKKEHTRIGEDGKEYLADDLVERGRITSWEPDNDRFMRCNINGGDSFAYYYHRDQENPYLHNFKGEPAIRLKEFDPQFYAEHVVPHFEELSKNRERPFVFRDKLTDKYYIGTRKDKEIVEQPNVVGSSEKKIGDYFIQMGATSPPAVIQSWTRMFDPRVFDQWNEDTKIFNTWKPTEYQQNTLFSSAIPPTIERVIRHVTGNDEETFEHFINWVACIQQTREKTGTAWVLHGVPGTGKGLLFNYILRPIFGQSYCQIRQIKDLKDRFNGWMEQCILCNIDEANAEDLSYEAKEVVNALKNWITEPKITVRHMQAMPYDAWSFINFIFTTNDFGILPIQEGDRRMNVAPRQMVKLEITPEDVEKLEQELQQFSNYLMHYKYDAQRARTPMESKAKQELKEAAMTSIEEFFHAAAHGDLAYFIDGLDEDTSEYGAAATFKQAVAQWIDDAKAGRPSQVTVPQLKAAHVVMCRDKGMKSGHFKSMAAKRGFPAGMRRQGDTRWRGWQIDWTPQTLAEKVQLKMHLKSVEADVEQKIKSEIAEKGE